MPADTKIDNVPTIGHQMFVVFLLLTVIPSADSDLPHRGKNDTLKKYI